MFKQVFAEYSQDEVPRRAAALAFYTVLSLAPLLTLIIALASFAGAHIQDQIVMQFTNLVGEKGGDLVRTVLSSADETTGLFATIASFIMLLLGASGVFTELRDTLDRMWDVPERKLGWKGYIMERLFGFALVLSVGFLLLVSLVASTIISMASNIIAQYLPPFLLVMIDIVVAFIVITTLFALLFRYVPQTRASWKSVFLGAACSAVLFIIGKWAIGLYLGKASIVSSYGAAGSLVVILIWVYYTAQIFFLGAEIAQVADKKTA